MSSPAEGKDPRHSQKQRGSLISLEKSAVAGAVAGGVSRIFTAPFDLLKIRLQLQVGPVWTRAQRDLLIYPSLWTATTKIVGEEGLIGLWRGNLAATYLWVGYGAVQFPVYEDLRSRDFGPFLSGAAAGLVATVVTYPFDVIRTQFAAQGVPRGLGPTVLQIIPRMGVAFEVFEQLGQTWSHRHDPNSVWGWLVQGINGGLAGGVARAAIHPLDTVKRRMQAQVMVQKRVGMYGYLPSFHHSFECFHYIIRNEGVAALYKGLVASILKSMLSFSLTFVAYQATMEAMP